MLREWTGVRTGYPRDAGLAELFAARVAAAPERSGAPLRRRGADLPAARRAGQPDRPPAAGPRSRRGTHVALALERSLDLVPAILGVIKAGGAYVPLDAAYPKERLALMLDDVAAPVLVTQSALLESLPVGEAAPACASSA